MLLFLCNYSSADSSMFSTHTNSPVSKPRHQFTVNECCCVETTDCRTVLWVSALMSMCF